MARTFQIRDSHNRCWGTFVAKELVLGEINGHLKASPDYKEVQNVFRQHDAAMAVPNGDSEATGKKIIALGAYLVDQESGRKFNIGKIIYVSEDLLVSCQVEIE